MAVPPKTLDPPFYDPPIVDAATGQQQHSQAWTEYHQQSADQLSAAAKQIKDLTTQLAAVRHGVTDGSDAAAGDIGELLTASGGPVALTSGVLTTVATLNLTAGDWDVTGYVVFRPVSGGPRSFYGVGIDALDVFFSTTFDAGTNNSGFTTATRRYNVTATTAVHIVAQAVFTSGGLNVTGVGRARRMR